MHTGELAVMDEGGYVNIVGRIKDMASGRENLPAASKSSSTVTRLLRTSGHRRSRRSTARNSIWLRPGQSGCDQVIRQARSRITRSALRQVHLTSR
jgi:hypothetical protein